MMMLQIMVQCLHTGVGKKMIQKMIQHSYVDAARDGLENDKKMIAEEDPAEIDDEDL